MLIEVYHVVAGEYPVDPDFAADTMRGNLVMLDSATGLVGLCDATHLPIGLAGDSQSNTTAGTAYHANLVIGADGAYLRSTQNRVADAFNESLASGKLTVYSSGGVFRVTTYKAADEASLTPGTALYPAASGEISITKAGLDLAGGAYLPVGQVLEAPTYFQSGVPGGGVNGSEFVRGSMPLADVLWMTFKLLV
jgi:hypothetical protein